MPMAEERLQKIIAAAGITSRRKAEELITAGRVSVNGQTVSQLGAKADLARDHIRVDGKLLRAPERHVYFLVNKPRGYVTSVTDPEGRPTIMDIVHGAGTRVYPVGRLDYASEGLVLLTNDGDLTQKLMHASSHVPKTYLVKVAAKPSAEALNKLRSGVTIPLDDRPGKTPPLAKTAKGRAPKRFVKTAPARIQLARDAPNPWYEVTLIEGRNRQIRRMFEKVGHHVEKIKRVRYGNLELDVPPGEWRPLTAPEVERLKTLASGKAAAIKRGARPVRGTKERDE
jgi:23S rRNA pseudouridine2605 synthase